MPGWSALKRLITQSGSVTPERFTTLVPWFFTVK